MLKKIMTWCVDAVDAVIDCGRRIALTGTAAVGLGTAVVFGQAPPDPSEAVITAIEGVQPSALGVIAAAGGVLVAIGIVAVLWRIGLKWLRRVGGGG